MIRVNLSSRFSRSIPGLTIIVIFVVVCLGTIARKPSLNRSQTSQPSSTTIPIASTVNGQRTQRASTEAKSQSEKIPATQSLASGFSINNITGNQNNGYQVTLTNGYRQSVVAFQIGVGRGRMTRDFLLQDGGIPPGSSHIEYHAYEPDMATKPLTLFGVVFEDGSGDGDPRAVMAIKDMRLGNKIELTQCAPVLEEALKLARGGSSRILDTLESRINSLPIGPVEGLSSYVKFGAHNEKQRLVSEIRRMRESGIWAEQREGNHLEKELLHLKLANERRASKLARQLVQ